MEERGNYQRENPSWRANSWRKEGNGRQNKSGNADQGDADTNGFTVLVEKDYEDQEEERRGEQVRNRDTAGVHTHKGHDRSQSGRRNYHQRNSSDPNQFTDVFEREIDSDSPPPSGHEREREIQQQQERVTRNPVDRRQQQRGHQEAGAYASEETMEDSHPHIPSMASQKAHKDNSDEDTQTNTNVARKNPYYTARSQSKEEELEDSDDLHSRGKRDKETNASKIREEDPRNAGSEEKSVNLEIGNAKTQPPDRSHDGEKYSQSAQLQKTSSSSKSPLSERVQQERPEDTILEPLNDYSPPAGITGLNNLGNTCFFSSVLQALSHIVPLRRYFLEIPFSSERATHSEGHMADMFRRLLSKLWSGRFSCLSPTGMLHQLRARNPMFEGFSQHDAQEALRFLLDHMHDLLAIQMPMPYHKLSSAPFLGNVNISETTYSGELEALKDKYKEHLSGDLVADYFPDSKEYDEYNLERKQREMSPDTKFPGWINSGPFVDAPLEKRSFISDLFQGILANRTRCHECEHESVTFDNFWDLSLPIPSNGGRHHLARMADTALRSRGGSGDLENEKCSNAANAEVMDMEDTVRTLASSLKEEPQACDLPFLLPKAAGAQVQDHVPKGAGVTSGDEQNIGPPKEDEAMTLSGYESETSDEDDNSPKTMSEDSTGSVWKSLVSKLLCPARKVGKVFGFGENDLSIYDLFYGFCDKETLSGGNAYHCSHCRKKVQATKTLSLVEPPAILCLHLKRFSYSPRSFWGGSKIDTEVRFPIKGFDISPFLWDSGVSAAKQQLKEATRRQEQQVRRGDVCLPNTKRSSPRDSELTFSKAPFKSPSSFFPLNSDAHTSEALSHSHLSKIVTENRIKEKKDRFCTEIFNDFEQREEAMSSSPKQCRSETLNTTGAYRSDCQYDLVALVRHLGGFGGGHYVTYAIHSENEKWYLFDDERVTETSADTVSSVQAYLLFYVRRDVTSSMTKLLQALKKGDSPWRERFVMDSSGKRVVPTIETLQGFFLRSCKKRIRERFGGIYEEISLDIPLVKKLMLLETVPFLESCICEIEGVSKPLSKRRLKHIEIPQCCFISRDWWLRWQTIPKPGPVTSADISSAHGRVKATLMDRWIRAEVLPAAVVPVPLEVYAWWSLQFGASGPPIWDMKKCDGSIMEKQLLKKRRAQEHSTIRSIDTSRTQDDQNPFRLVKEDSNAIDYRKCWFLLSSSWLQQWRDFVYNRGYSDATGRGVLPPGPVDNAKLLHASGKPHRNLKPQTHYRGVNYKVWEYFMRVYGGGPILCRSTLDIYDTSSLPTVQEDSDETE